MKLNQNLWLLKFIDRRITMDAKEIKLREELDSIDETMALKRREIEDLKKKKEKPISFVNCR